MYRSHGSRATSVGRGRGPLTPPLQSASQLAQPAPNRRARGNVDVGRSKQIRPGPGSSRSSTSVGRAREGAAPPAVLDEVRPAHRLLQGERIDQLIKVFVRSGPICTVAVARRRARPRTSAGSHLRGPHARRCSHLWPSAVSRRSRSLDCFRFARCCGTSGTPQETASRK